MQPWDRFGQAVQRLFQSWTALQIAVREEFGGARSAAKAHELQNELIAFFSANQTNIYPDELVEELKEQMDEKFNVAVEDGSLEEISAKLIMFFSLLKTGDTGIFDRELARISGHANLTASVAAPEAEDFEMDDAEILSESLEEMNIQSGSAGRGAAESIQEDPLSGPVPVEPRRPRNEPDADGWTLVAGSGKRKTGL